MALACSMLAPSAAQDSPRLGSLRDDPRFAELLATGRSVEATMSSLSVVEFSPSIEASCFLHRCRPTLNKLRTRSSDLSVIDRVTGLQLNSYKFKRCTGGKIPDISHSVPCATVFYPLRCEYSGHKLSTRKNRIFRECLPKSLMELEFLVGARGFEPPTSRSQTKGSAKT